MTTKKMICIPMCVMLLLCTSICFATQSLQPTDASGFVILSEAIPDAIIEARYYSTYNFVGDRIDGYEESIALLTKEAATALRAVSDELVEKGYRLKIYDAYRPQTAVDHFVRWAKDKSDVRMKPYFYPDLDKSVLFKQSYIAQKSGHSRGSTVDLTLFDMSTGKEVDMGGTFDYFGKRSHPDYTGITPEQHANRMLLREVMMAHGFKPLSTEWWHFTLKDEPYPNTFFSFPVATSVLPQSVDQDIDLMQSEAQETILAESENKEDPLAQSDSDKADPVQHESQNDAPLQTEKQTNTLASPATEIFLQRGMKSEAVRYYQERLIAAGYLIGPADGSFGAKTESAVIQFQQANNLEPTGIITNVEADLLSDYQ